MLSEGCESIIRKTKIGVSGSLGRRAIPEGCLQFLWVSGLRGLGVSGFGYRKGEFKV